jgi:hypothetical protein
LARVRQVIDTGNVRQINTNPGRGGLAGNETSAIVAGSGIVAYAAVWVVRRQLKHRACVDVCCRSPGSFF